MLSPHVPKYTQLFGNKTDFINTNLNSGDWFSLSPVRSRDFHVNLIFTVQAWELSDSQGAGEWSLFLWCGRGQSFSLLLTSGLDRDMGGIPRWIPYISFLYASTSLGKILLFPQWGWKYVWTSGSFPSRPQRPVCQFTITRRNSVLSLLTKLPSHFSGFPRRYVESETCIKQPLYQPAYCLSYQPNEFYVENNVCY